jgi:16S rRNA (cytosine967-C5)-methyltransferase
MSRFHSYINTTKGIIEQYKNEMPLHLYLKNFFSQDKKFGSKDRKTITSLCYYYYRLGHGENSRSIEERILLGIFLCEFKSNKILEQLKPEWNAKIALPLQEKLFQIESFYSSNIFPWVNQLSEGIEGGTFSISFLLQPKLFLRIRPGNEWSVLKKLEAETVSYHVISESSVAFENGSKLQEILEFNSEVVVQDYNSQRVGEFIQLAYNNMEYPACSVWDCVPPAAASLLWHTI